MFRNPRDVAGFLLNNINSLWIRVRPPPKKIEQEEVRKLTNRERLTKIGYTKPIPTFLTCIYISQDLMEDPVLVNGKHTFEKSSLDCWLLSEEESWANKLASEWQSLISVLEDLLKKSLHKSSTPQPAKEYSFGYIKIKQNELRIAGVNTPITPAHIEIVNKSIKVNGEEIHFSHWATTNPYIPMNPASCTPIETIVPDIERAALIEKFIRSLEELHAAEIHLKRIGINRHITQARTKYDKSGNFSYFGLLSYMNEFTDLAMKVDLTTSAYLTETNIINKINDYATFSLDLIAIFTHLPKLMDFVSLTETIFEYNDDAADNASTDQQAIIDSDQRRCIQIMLHVLRPIYLHGFIKGLNYLAVHCLPRTEGQEDPETFGAFKQRITVELRLREKLIIELKKLIDYLNQHDISHFKTVNKEHFIVELDAALKQHENSRRKWQINEFLTRLEYIPKQRDVLQKMLVETNTTVAQIDDKLKLVRNKNHTMQYIYAMLNIENSDESRSELITLLMEQRQHEINKLIRDGFVLSDDLESFISLATNIIQSEQHTNNPTEQDILAIRKLLDDLLLTILPENAKLAAKPVEKSDPRVTINILKSINFSMTFSEGFNPLLFSRRRLLGLKVPSVPLIEYHPELKPS